MLKCLHRERIKALQVEGNYINSDVWAEEYSEGSPYADKSGDAVDHYRLYREDIKIEMF